MNVDQLVELIQRDEGPTLEFKRAWYPIDAEATEARERSRGELIKDVLSLANGSASTAGDKAYLVVGVSDTRDENGGRETYDAIDFPTDGVCRRIAQLLSSASDPPVDHLEFDVVEFESRRIGVLTIHPTSHVHETTRRLRTSSTEYSERTVFMRTVDGIGVAGADDRDAIRRHKRHRAKEYGRVSPIGFGGLVGSLTGALAAGVFGIPQAATVVQRTAILVLATVLSGILGLGIGWAVRQYLEIRRDWYRLPVTARWVFAVLLLALVLWTFFQLLTPIAG